VILATIPVLSSITNAYYEEKELPFFKKGK
jgi:hypothetical protein